MKNTKIIEPRLTKNRIEALSDGVFAIVMTLMVIELSVPVVPKLLAAEQLGAELVILWPKFAAFVISFLVLGILWFCHHFHFHYTIYSNGMFSWINIIFLMFIALIPFSTALIGEYHIYSQTAVIFYGANVFFSMIMCNISWWYSTKRQKFMDEKVDPQKINKIQIRLIWMATAFLVAIGLSFVKPIISIIIYSLVSIYGIYANITCGSLLKKPDGIK